jgi:hypothetical protein
MKQVLIATMLMAGIASSTWAQEPVKPPSIQEIMADADAMRLVQDLGAVLASEEMCGLAYDQDAITAFIGRNVDPDNLSFTSLLGTATRMAANGYETISQSLKTAHCAQTARVAKTYGFIN